jgi:hypothetical protein
MASGQLTITVEGKFRWWVRPLCHVARVLAAVGIRPRIGGFIARHGSIMRLAGGPWRPVRATMTYDVTDFGKLEQ